VTPRSLISAQEALSGGLPQGFALHRADCLGSTNDEAVRMALEGAPSGTIVMAGRQTSGRGRLGRQWVSPPGNLYASIIVRPDCALAATTDLSLLTAVALGEALGELGPAGLEIALKWPNDILLNRAKVAGILLENAVGDRGRAAFVVIGTGVNIRSAPAGAAYPVTCLDGEGFPRSLSPLDLLAAYAGRLEIWLDRWRRDGFPVVREAWRDRAFGIGRAIRLRLDREEIDGVFLDLTEGGALLIEQADGRRREVAAGDVVYPGA
jgi:BirA family biotin operon repressor/biotin-[acetyl-CoA-carboxylase] ligase